MKKFACVLLCTIFTILITSSIQYIYADHTLGDNGIFKDQNAVNLVSSNDSEYIIHVQIVVRNAEGQIVSVTEKTHGKYIPHEMTDEIFHNSLDTGKLVKIDKIVYEKGIDQSTWTPGTPTGNVQKFTFPYSIHDIQSGWGLQYCIDVKNWSGKKDHGNAQGLSCLPFFTVITGGVTIAEDDVFTLYWTILKKT